MRSIIQAAVLFCALPASAQAIHEPRACQVTLARAPDDVRQVVEAWVRSEAHCNIALEVRIVPTEGGLYLLARDDHGGVRERIVPDAETAGVLVASWVADDNASSPIVVPPVVSPPAALAPAPMGNESIAPPGMAPVVITASASGPASRSMWFTAGAIVPMGPGSSFGLRGELDVWRTGQWTLGGAASITRSETMIVAYPNDGPLSMTDGKLMAVIARTSTWGRWHLRPAIGAGIIHSEGSVRVDAYAQVYAVEGTFAAYEASLALARDIGRRWGAYAGLVASATDQRYEVMMLETDDQPSYQNTMYRDDYDLSLFAGVRYRL